MKQGTLFVCPQCHPGPIWYSGPIVSRVCGACRAANDNDADRQREAYDRARRRREA